VASPLRIAFRGVPRPADASVVQVDVPWLAGAATEEVFPNASPAAAAQGVRLFRTGGLLLGHAREPFVAEELATRTEALYRRIFAACRGRYLFRIWNYIPQINAATAGLENYRAFCLGRSLAFEANLGDGFQPHLPAASAVGREGNHLELVFAAGETAPRHFENPEQVPAYFYPTEHGPRAPSFARATVGRDGQRTFMFISGTSSIKGHRTVAPGQLDQQIDCTLDNLRLVSRAVGLGDDLGADHNGRRHFKIYLRHGSDLAAARMRLEGALLRPTDTVTYLQANICRAALLVEIEATLVT
jgi:hypothetical protein